MPTHYETLGVKSGASASEIRSAYRKIVLRHHPDRSKDPRSKEIFIAATSAYDVLSDDDARSQYDLELATRSTHEEQIARDRERMQEHARAAAAAAAAQNPFAGQRPGWAPPQEDRVTSANVAENLRRLTTLHSRGNYHEAEELARQIVAVAPRTAFAYAVMGDIARLHGDVNEAAKFYAYAAQFEPTNRVYQRRYEELLSSTRVVQGRNSSTTLAHEDGKVLAPMAAGVITLASAIYVGVSSEAALFRKIPIVSTWTFGIAILLFVVGVSIGAALSSGNLLDRFQAVATTATGRLGPSVAVGLVAIANFWLAAAIYLGLGIFQRAWSFSISRLTFAIAFSLFVMAFAGAVGHDHILFGQTLLWGGNIEYLGALLGWLVADSFRGGPLP